jgi:hypothetical protein
MTLRTPLTETHQMCIGCHNSHPSDIAVSSLTSVSCYILANPMGLFSSAHAGPVYVIIIVFLFAAADCCQEGPQVGGDRHV